jgi:hypothetical protein
MGVPIDSIFYVGFYIGSALLPHTYNGFQNFGKKNFFLRHKSSRKNISSYSEFVTKKVFTFGGWVGLIIFYISLFVINQ